MKDLNFKGSQATQPVTVCVSDGHFGATGEPCVSIIPSHGSVAVCRDEFADFIEWGQQWLKENPKRVDEF